jgi:2-polyprenyl-3-methyl-5-hydroxy-6-metoxy-1,4-benzoquinol methylase
MPDASGELAFSIYPGAALTQPFDGCIELLATAGNYQPAVSATVLNSVADPNILGTRVHLDLELLEGSLGAYLTEGVNGISGPETAIDRVGRQRVLVNSTANSTTLWLRSLSEGQARARIYGLGSMFTRRFDFSPILNDVLPEMLRGPSESALDAVARGLSQESGQIVTSEMIGGLSLDGVSLPFSYPPFEAIFADEVGQSVVQETKRLTSLLPTLNVEKLGEFLGELDRDFFALYFRETTVRVYHMVKTLQEFGLTGGTVLEVGSLMGNFSVVLARLGYNVTAVDRYTSYQGAAEEYLDYMRSLGISVEATTREDEAKRIGALGTYDAVICMAVIEHIPPPARPFLEMLKSHVKPGGVLLLDTPNIVRWGNRMRLAQGRTIHQDLKSQYHTEPPWEGHHREYTPDEMVWMLQEVGCSDVSLKMFDYNLLQFEALHSAQVPELIAATVDPAQADTIMVAGRVQGR